MRVSRAAFNGIRLHLCARESRGSTSTRSLKVYSAPEGIEPPVIDYKNFSLEAYEKSEREYLERLKQRLIELGWNGPNTGEEFRIPWADGHARYMVAEAGRRMVLVHLPLFDAWGVPEYMTRGLRKADVVRHIKSSKARSAPFFKAA